MNMQMILIVIALAAALTALLTALFIPLLKKKAGQNIREEGPKAHMKKAGTPGMGGIAFVLTMLVYGIVLCFVFPDGIKNILFVILSTLLYCLIGFYDDYLKIIKHENEGLTAKQKFILQIILGLCISVGRWLLFGSNIYIPFIKKTVDFGLFVIPFTCFVFVAMTNAVNLTDGLDGLSSSVTMNVSIFMGILFNRLSLDSELFKKNDVINVILAFILTGCCIGFLIFNRNPAKIFMGDTGSLALGAYITSLAMTSGYDFLLPILGLVYVIEVISVIIQVTVFKTQNGRRFFKMAPIHHHFEMCGWSEKKVDTVFCLVTVVMGVICLLAF